MARPIKGRGGVHYTTLASLTGSPGNIIQVRGGVHVDATAIPTGMPLVGLGGEHINLQDA